MKILWDGSGEMPPVGTTCEYRLLIGYNRSSPWFECEIISHNRLVINCPHLEDDESNGLQVILGPIEFRPMIPYDLVREAMESIDAEEGDWCYAEGLVKRMVAAGYRKETK